MPKPKTNYSDAFLESGGVPRCSAGLINEKWLLTTEELAFLLGLATVTIKNSRKSELLLGRSPPPHIKVGRLVRYRREDVFAWVQDLPG